MRSPTGPRLSAVALEIELSPDAVRRLQDAADRRGLTVEELVAEFLENLVPAHADEPHRLGFVGIGDSGDDRPADIHRERAELAAKKSALGR